ncbi:AI-2E family transporter [Flavobacteriaceae bacterium Ap0902]|nr:AI-2E family transporter [Flavobacteriaceae bacterium Ap0902]
MNSRLQFHPKQYFFILGSIILSIVGLYYGSGFLVPFSFSILLSFILMQPLRWLEKKKIPTPVAIIGIFLAVIGIIFGITYFFSSQIATLITDFNNFRDEFASLLDSGINQYNQTFDFLPPIDKELVTSRVTNYFENSGSSILSTTFSQTSSFFASAFLVPVYVFLLLLYRKGIKKGITFFFRPEKRESVEQILNEVQSVGKSYIIGLFTVMLILAVINSIALLIIGVDYAIMFGCLAALLIIIPYIGTYLGAAMPILYALVTIDATHALFVLIAFVVIQALEGNILTPKIVGSNTSVNPLTAFIALIVGGYVWGISGMILSIPFVAMLKKVFRHVSGLQPLSLLMGEELYEKDIHLPADQDQIEIPEEYKADDEDKSKKSSKISRVLHKLFFDNKKSKDSDI